MPFQLLNRLGKSGTKQFVEFLIKEKYIKSGFGHILNSKTLEQIHHYLLHRKIVNDDRLTEAYAQFYHLPYLRLVEKPIEVEAAKLLSEETCRKFSVICYKRDGLDIFIAVGEPYMLQMSAPQSLVKLRQQKGLRIHLSITPRDDVTALIKKVYQEPSEQQEKPPAVLTQAPVQDIPSQPVLAQPAVQQHIAEPVPQTPGPHPELIKKAFSDMKTVDLTRQTIDQKILQKIPYSVAKKYKVIVFGQEEPTSEYEPPLIKVAVVRPDDSHVKEILGFIEQRNQVLIDRYLTNDLSFMGALKKYPEFEVEQEKLRTQQIQNVFATQNKPLEQPATTQPKVGEFAGLKPQVSAQPLPQKVEPQPSPSTVQITPSDQVYTLTSEDIITRPEESSEDLKELARQTADSLEEQDLDKLLKNPVTSVDDLARIMKRAQVPEIVAGTLFLGIRMKASDVHIEPEKEEVRFRYRIDGILHDVIKVPLFLLAPLVSRVKILSRMKIDEQRVPQDGRFDVIIDKRQVDLRISTLPTVHGEKVVMRLLDKTQGVMSLEKLGVTGSNFDRLVQNVNKPYGVILSTGPTGSGKTTTLYAILNRISKPGVNIITLEDPVEYELEGINQSQVKPQIGFSFAEGLRSVLRQDPNIIMVGEIRDLETAAMATHAALTGHLVISTLHTNDAAGALPRLINMGVEPFLITSSMNVVIGQRLVRKVCDHCREKELIPPAVLRYIKKELEEIPTGQVKGINLEQLVFHHGKGCGQCTNGYRGRIGIFEVLTMSDEIEELAVAKAPASSIKKAAIKDGMVTMTQDGLIKALKGITTIDEVLRVTTTEIKEMPGMRA